MYGDVYLAKSRESGEKVAIKKLKSSDDMSARTFDVLALREIKILKAMQHENVIRMIEVVTDKAGGDGKLPVYMVMPCMKHDLRGLLDATASLYWDQSMIKGMCCQLLSGVQYLHSRDVIHRDLKPENLLMDEKGYIKITDFGLAKVCRDEYKKHTNSVVTLWYRAPELLLGTNSYDNGIDMWSVGCIMAEFLMNGVLMPGHNEPKQLDLIWNMCGTPKTEGWRAGTKLPLYHRMTPRNEIRRDMTTALTKHIRNIRKPYFTKGAVAILDRVLKLDSSKRPSAKQLLKDPYFTVDKPAPKRPEQYIQYQTSYFSNKDGKRKSQKKRKTAQ